MQTTIDRAHFEHRMHGGFLSWIEWGRYCQKFYEKYENIVCRHACVWVCECVGVSVGGD